jgi:hypothetical protein
MYIARLAIGTGTGHSNGMLDYFLVDNGSVAKAKGSLESRVESVVY